MHKEKHLSLFGLKQKYISDRPFQSLQTNVRHKRVFTQNIIYLVEDEWIELETMCNSCNVLWYKNISIELGKKCSTCLVDLNEQACCEIDFKRVCRRFYSICYVTRLITSLTLPTHFSRLQRKLKINYKWKKMPITYFTMHRGQATDNCCPRSVLNYYFYIEINSRSTH